MRLAFVGVAVLWFMGCASSAQVLEETQKSITTQAAFDMNCPEKKLKLKNLDTRPHAVKDPSMSRKWGVTGCGRRGTYVYVNHTWIANTASR